MRPLQSERRPQAWAHQSVGNPHWGRRKSVLRRNGGRVATLALGLIGALGWARAQDADPRAKAPETKVKELRVDPAPAPRPALRYRLLPLAPDRTPGDAAPIYLRLRHELPDEAMR